MGHSFLIKPIFYERKSDNSVIAAGNQSGIHFSCVYLYGVMLLLSVIISLHFWFKDLIREFYKKYEVLLMILFLAYLIFLVSEGLLFISFFWGTFHSLSSPNYGMCPGEGLYVPDPCELTFANTLLLSNAAVSLGGAVVSLESSCSFSILFSLFSGILAWALLVCKSKNSVSWVSQSMILFIVVSSLCLQDYISFILSLVFSF